MNNYTISTDTETFIQLLLEDELENYFNLKRKLIMNKICVLDRSNKVSYTSVPSLNIYNSFKLLETGNANNDETDNTVTEEGAPKSKFFFFNHYGLECKWVNTEKRR